MRASERAIISCIFLSLITLLCVWVKFDYPLAVLLSMITITIIFFVSFYYKVIENMQDEVNKLWN